MSPAPPTSLRHAIAGGLILTGLALQVLRLAGLPIALPAVSYAFWLAVVLLWPDLKRGNRRQAGILAGLGMALALVAALFHGAEIAWHRLLDGNSYVCLLYTSPSPRDRQKSRMPSSA